MAESTERRFWRKELSRNVGEIEELPIDERGR
jgi:hypothetical protein